MAPSGKQSKRDKRSSGSHVKESSSSSRQAPSSTPGVSFLFMVNELRFHDPDRDTYANLVPPTNPFRYTQEIASQVMLYSAGTVTPTVGYQWYRDISAQGGDHTEGNLWMVGADGQSYTVEMYSQCAVFACNPLLPLLVCPADPYAVPTNSSWQLLQIHTPRAVPGLSQVAHEDSLMPEGPGLARHVAGRSPSWIPSLLPETYKFPSGLASPPQSAGLGGELAIVLGLMALTADPDPSDQNRSINFLFLGSAQQPGGAWRNKRWFVTGRPRGHPPTIEHNPRGFLVTVFLDPNNMRGSTRDSLRWFEWQRPIVVE